MTRHLQFLCSPGHRVLTSHQKSSPNGLLFYPRFLTPTPSVVLLHEKTKVLLAFFQEVWCLVIVLLDFDAHTSTRAHDNFVSRLEIAGAHVGDLPLGDFPDLVLGNGSGRFV